MNKKRGQGFFWFAIDNNETEYSKLSGYLADSIRNSGTTGGIAVAGDVETCKKLRKKSNIDHVIEIPNFKTASTGWNFHNDWKLLSLTPFVHTVKLEADMIIPTNINAWWNILKQHDMVFSYDCYDINNNLIRDRVYRKIFIDNKLPNVYNALSYFRYSVEANKFFELCRVLTENWDYVRDSCIVKCYDKHPTTDIIYALALKIMDPLELKKIDYDFFKIIHFKPGIHCCTENLTHKFVSVQENNQITVGGNTLMRLFHYHYKDYIENIL